MTKLAAAPVLGIVLFAAALAGAQAPEPVSLGGTWAGTWWMGKYEEPIEMELVQRGDVLSGRVAMFGYPGIGRGGDLSDTALIQSGRLDGNRAELAWLMGGRRFTATLTFTARGTLFGLGRDDGQAAAGFDLSRVR